MLKENKKYRDTWEQVVTTRQHMVTIKVPEGKMDRGGGVEISNEKAVYTEDDLETSH